jgi:hypothetical protein
VTPRNVASAPRQGRGTLRDAYVPAADAARVIPSVSEGSGWAGRDPVGPDQYPHHPAPATLSPPAPELGRHRPAFSPRPIGEAAAEVIRGREQPARGIAQRPLCLRQESLPEIRSPGPTDLASPEDGTRPASESPISMLAPQLIADYMLAFYGYGTHAAKYWFLGMEEGGGALTIP